ncbi:Phage transcriptional regulator [Bifidobacterium saguini DSM 23967]|uniref:Phage transcriptional regulator n=2 Tax=Bifidobacterium saguini TaxID=762210 RepID=A0A087DAC7_9BIFI|nr:transcriptional regulator [Bifidobacterium saguini]KFI92477.1 Phage transcriptional regulator [Bifidobacterium saguini DSM 23967]QTB90799.1 XRE family transcriptional regulator [Bifidobacterium saguini]QTB90861.1 XRE family transcriptional regulator [Bifidobacterium saguini]
MSSQPVNATAVCTRSGGWWAVEVPEIPGLFTQARRLDQVEEQVRDAAEMLDVTIGTVTIDPQLDETTRRMVELLYTKRDEARKAQDDASKLARSTVATLRSEGLTVRDVAMVTGVSPQRVSALQDA